MTKESNTSKCLILKATDAETVRAVVAGHDGVAAGEVQGAAGAAIDHTAPVATAAAVVIVYAIGVVAVTCQNKFQG